MGEEEEGERLLRVAAWSRPGKVAGAIAGLTREGKLPVLQAMGPRAVNQAVKAVAIARIFLAEEDIELICIPELIEVSIENHERTAVRLIVKPL